MSHQATGRVVSSTIGNARAKLVLHTLADHAHPDGRNAWCARQTLAQGAECSVKTVDRQLDFLLERGWIRLGDQQQVAHLRGDRRPVVYDIAMDEATRLEWATAAADDLPGRGDILTPRPVERGDTQMTPRGDSHGATSDPSRGDTAVSPEPKNNNTPQPPPAGEPDPATRPTRPRCARPGPTPHANCRGCGTTTRQIAEAERRAADARRRARSAEQAAADRAQRDRLADPTVRALADPARAATRAAAESARAQAVGW